MKVCPHCQQPFKPTSGHQKFCTPEHRLAAQKQRQLEQQDKEAWFVKEWCQWKRDFANGLTVSNL